MTITGATRHMTAAGGLNWQQLVAVRVLLPGSTAGRPAEIGACEMEPSTHVPTNPH
jgi:hypothetical protein